MRGNETFIDNLKIDTSSASSKCFDKQKEIDGLNWWGISRLGDKLRTYSKNISVASKFSNIFKYTPIRQIILDINGSDDSGCLESVTLSAQGEFDFEDIFNNYFTGSVRITERYNEEGSFYWQKNIDYLRGYDLNSLFNNYFDGNHADDLSSEGFAKYVNESINKINEEISLIDVFTSPIVIHNMNTIEREFSFFLTSSESTYINGFPYYYGNNHINTTEICHPLTLKYNKVPIQDWSAIEDHAYSQLEGGWEINEGSQNVVIYTLRENGDSYNVECFVEQNRNIMEVETYEEELKFNDKDLEKVRNFIKDELKINTWETTTLDFNKKKDRENIIAILDFVGSLYVEEG